MLLKMGCKAWTRGTQLGLRIYTDTIRDLSTILNIPSSNQVWDTLAHFIQVVGKNKKVPPYTRNILVVSRRKSAIQGSMTIAKHGRTTQGYITAPHNSWFYNYVKKNLNKNYYFGYTPQYKTDLLIIPKHEEDIRVEFNRDEKKIHRKVVNYCSGKHLSLPPNAEEIGLFYEIKEKEYLENAGLLPYHRYPSVLSTHLKLLKREIFCDIDVFTKEGKFLKFVEVKSVSAAPGTPFHLTIKEYESRKKCIRRNWSYEIVVYYHIGTNVIRRQVINLDDELTTFPSGYLCCLKGEE